MTVKEDMLAQIEATPPEPARVSNQHGALVHGMPGQRTVVLIHTKRFRAMAEADDILLTSTAAVQRVVLAVGRMRLVTPPAEGPLAYRLVDDHALPSFEQMLVSVASSVAYEDDMTSLQHQGQSVPLRRFAPMDGLRRRGYSAIRHVQRAHGLTDEVMAQVVDQLCRASFS